MKLAVLEFDYHAEVLRNLCEGLEGSGIETVIFCTVSIARTAGGAARFPGIHWECPGAGEHTISFVTRKLAAINACDAVLFNTLASNFRFFSQLALTPPVVLRVHNAATYLSPNPEFKPIFTPFFLWKDASHLLRKTLGEREAFWRTKFVQRVDYFCFPDAALEASVREKGWLEGRQTMAPLPFTVHEPGHRKAPQSGHRALTVIGSIDPRRRDYAALLDALESIQVDLRSECTLTLLGRPRGSYGQKLLKRFQRLQSAHFTVNTYTAFVPQEEFERVLRDTDFLVIPALDKTRYTLYTEQYGQTKISGNVYDMIRYGKPTIMPEHYRLDPDVATMTARYRSKAELARHLKNWIDDDGLQPHVAAVDHAVARFLRPAVQEQMRLSFAELF
ncbi:MAG: hypothetical protein GC205_05145 [Bacteroidetes bacterium]|nr:hypothetical protein [Bacteroidota bacterium]